MSRPPVPPVPPAPPVRRVHVVVPAHDEEDLVTGCLQALVVAMDAVGTSVPEVGCTLVLDDCTDRTADRAAPFLLDPRFRVALTGARNVGAARHLGITVPSAPRTVGGGHTAPVSSEEVWVLCTDADTVVPPDWITEHLRLTPDRDLVVGAVRPDAHGLPPALLRAWEAAHAGPRVAVHGANLGFRLSAYLAVGGFPPLMGHEDVALVRALRAGAARGWCRGTTVTTSARRDGRAPDGFAGYLRDLADRAPA